MVRLSTAAEPKAILKDATEQTKLETKGSAKYE